MQGNRTYLTIFVGVLAFLVLWTAWFEWQNLEARLRSEHDALAAEVSAIAEGVGRSFEVADVALRSIVAAREQDLIDGSTSANLQAGLEALDAALPQVRALVVFGVDGLTIADSSAYPPLVVSVRDRDYFMAFAESGLGNTSLFVGEPVRGRVSGEWFLSMARGVRGADDGFGGIVLAVIDLDYLRGQLREGRRDNGARALLATRSGTVVDVAGLDDARPEGPIRHTGRRVQDLPPFAAVDAAPDSATVRTLDGALVAMAPVEGVQLYVVLARDLEAIRTEWLKAVAPNAGALLFVIAVAGLLWRPVRAATREREQLFLLSPDPVAILDGDGAFVHANPAWGRLLAIPREALRATRLADYVHGADRPRWQRAVHRFDEGGSAGEMLLRVQRGDGGTAWLSLSAAADRGRIFVLGRDVTGRVAAEQALLESESRYRGIVNTVIDGIITIDERGIIRSVNPAAEAIFGYAAREMVGREVGMLAPETASPERRAFLMAWRDRPARLRVERDQELVGRRRDGTTFPLEVGVSEVFMGEQRHFIGICRDISERKRIERMKDEFVSTVSHELRTPLTSIRGSLSLIKGGAAGVLGDKAQRLLGIAHSNCERLVNLVNDILDIQRIESGRLEFNMGAVDLGDVVASAVDQMAGYAAQFSVRLQYERPEPMPVLGDIDRLVQVATNLIANAAKFSPPDEPVEVSVTRHGDFVRLAVRDRGPGVPDAFRDRIFHKFSQADSTDTRAKGGTGLGLSIVKAIVERHGGQVGFDSAPGQGATFHVDLPRRGGRDEPVPLPRVLLVEADPDLRALLRALIEPQVVVDEAARCADLVHYLHAGTMPDLVLLDPELPDGRGEDLLPALAQAEVPVVLLDDGPAPEGRSLHAPVVACLPKSHPGGHDLAAEVARILRRRLQERGGGDAEREEESIHG